MTRLLRIKLCDECPHAFGTRACKRAKVDGDEIFIIYRNNGGYHKCRRFSSYPVIPKWCPPEQDGPDWRPDDLIPAEGELS
jgi:hypothetical protein